MKRLTLIAPSALLLLTAAARPSEAVTLPYENNFSTTTAGVDAITSGAFGTDKSSWSHNLAEGRYEVSVIDGNLKNGGATIDVDPTQFGGAPSVAKDFLIEGSFGVTPDNDAPFGATQFAVWFLGEDQETTINNQYRLLLETDGSLVLEQRGTSFTTLAATTIAALEDDLPNTFDLAILGQYIDTDSDTINDSLLITATVDTGAVGGYGEVSALVGPTGVSSSIYTNSQITVHFRDRSDADLAGYIDSIRISNPVPEPNSFVCAGALICQLLAGVSRTRR